MARTTRHKQRGLRKGKWRNFKKTAMRILKSGGSREKLTASEQKRLSKSARANAGAVFRKLSKNRKKASLTKDFITNNKRKVKTRAQLARWLESSGKKRDIKGFDTGYLMRKSKRKSKR